jgi:hypothetical protein
MGPGDRRPERHIRDQFRDAETGPRLANAAEPRAFRVLIHNQLERRTGWLGRQDSNLGTAESKSDNFLFEINAHSEK